MTLIKELVDIPERVQKGDFVLKLTEGVGRAEETLRDYVVTPELAKCFEAALSFIQSAVTGRTSKATYLHGSFGSGKSHFMAVLHLILQGNAAARSIPELASVIQKHNDWIVGKKFLLVPFHLLGAHDMESGVLGQYVEFVRGQHPDARVPPVYTSAAIIAQARDERAAYGDDLFFARLNRGSASCDGDWGDLEAPWNAESFDAAADSPPDGEPHLQLVSALLKSVATSHAEVIGQRGGQFVRFDKGLSILSRHAKDLGYDALILFLDELILWLATQSADLGFVKREAAKLTNLVEAQSADRPVPIISFVSRQRDLRELVGDHVPGADRLSFSDSLDFQQGRFNTITLEDRNLPAIAEKRVLKCKSESAREELDAAFAQTIRMKDNVMNILLTHEGDRQTFRRVYPFSPALVQTLIAVSSVLQRERTALKVMMQLLVDHRETLRVGDLVPVGDLFDVVAHGDEAFSQDMAIHFDNAKRLYHQKLLPLLEKKYGARKEQIEQLPNDDATRTEFRSDDRLVKTLLLSALVPEVESLRGLNVERLAALNHGTIKVPVPGREGQEVLQRCREWAASVGEIRIGNERNPTISVQLSGVDTETIIEQAKREDNQGNRIRRIRQMLFEQLEIQGEGEFEQFCEFQWRNTKRTCTILFKNIRELPDSSFEHSDDNWRLVIDFPFDEQGHGPRDDLSKLQGFRERHPNGAKTLCWVPSFLSSDAQKDLGVFVILEHILTGERFGQYTSQLSPQDRQAAKQSLENQRSVLRERVKNHLDAAYGLKAFQKDSIDTTYELEPAEHFVSLAAGFTPQPPVAANLKEAMQRLLDQCLEWEFPGAPQFEAEVKTGVLKKVYELIGTADPTADGRIEIEKPQRPLLRHIANPLLLGEMGADATHFVLGQYWKTHFHRKAAQAGDTITVTQLRKWLDDPKPMGLPKEAQNLIMLIFAGQSDRSFYRHGGPCDVTLTNIPDDCELRTVALPSQKDWDLAVDIAGHLFGTPRSKLLTASNVTALSNDVKTRAKSARPACHAYHARLRDRLSKFGLSLDSDRLKTAAATLAMLDRLNAAEPKDVVHTLATGTIATSEAAMGECAAMAAEFEGNLDAAGWDIFEAVGKLTDGRATEATTICAEVQQALTSDEHAVQLAPALKAAQSRAVRLLTAIPPPPLIDPTKETDPVVDRRQEGERHQSKQNLTLSAAKDVLARLDQELKPGQTIRIHIGWVIQDGGESE